MLLPPRMMEDNIGYIAVTEFDVITVEQFKAAVDELEKDGMKGLIIDLRSNPGILPSLRRTVASINLQLVESR